MAVSLKNEGSQLSWDPPAKVSLSQRHSNVTVTVLFLLPPLRELSPLDSVVKDMSDHAVVKARRTEHQVD